MMMYGDIESSEHCIVNRQCPVTGRTACKPWAGIEDYPLRLQALDCDNLPRGNLSRDNMSYFINENNRLELSQLLISATS